MDRNELKWTAVDRYEPSGPNLMEMDQIAEAAGVSQSRQRTSSPCAFCSFANREPPRGWSSNCALQLLVRKGGKFVLRIEDTDLERSTKQSEDALLRDLSWLGLHWDEGPGVGGDYGPYRQSERNSLYKQHAEKLLDSGYVYRCFCSNGELEKMKEIAKLKQLPPVYTGKWATATDEEVQEELAKGTPYTYRFRVPKDGSLKINDLIRGEVSWNLDTLGDFVIMRSNGQPVYNFCVTVDDATMAISHVIRAEEHLPNTLRQALIYKVLFKNLNLFPAFPCFLALGFSMPYFAHVSLILAPDRSKLSKRHGATSVGQFREMGYLPQAMVNYFALLGWGDGTENEFFTLEQLVEKFSIGRVNKGGAIFDSTKLRWMNGQHLGALPSEELTKLVGERWKSTGILTESEGTFILSCLCWYFPLPRLLRSVNLFCALRGAKVESSPSEARSPPLRSLPPSGLPHRTSD
uniref:glutamate--tRNA ligase n=1 Tax=Quercus lobata TaxID=97700 RepID=A0A7N2LI57_QUELO